MHAVIYFYLPFSLFSKIGAKDEHFLPDLAQRLHAFSSFAAHCVGQVLDDWHVHHLSPHDATSHARSETIAHPPRWAPAFSLASTHCIPHRHCTSLGEPSHPSSLYRAGSPNCSVDARQNVFTGLAALTARSTPVKMSPTG